MWRVRRFVASLEKLWKSEKKKSPGPVLGVSS
jgi:hypothetical protein